MGVTARQQKVGIRHARVWGTAVPVGGSNGYYLRDDFRDEASVNVSPHDAAGLVFLTESVAATEKPVAGVLPMFLHYGDHWQNLLFALAMGGTSDGPSAIGTLGWRNGWNTGAGGAWSGKYATIVRDKNQKIVEIPSAKFHGFTLKTGTNGRLEIDWNFVGVGTNEASIINEADEIAALTFPPNGLRAFFSQATFKINARDGAVLSGVTPLKVTGFSLSFNQPIDQRYAAGGVSIVEPEDNGQPVVKLQLTFARYDSVSKVFTAYQNLQTPLKAEIEILGPVLETVYYRRIRFEMPNLFVESNSEPLPAGGTQSAPTVTLNGYGATTAPAGMSQSTPLRVDVIGIMPYDPLTANTPSASVSPSASASASTSPSASASASTA
jgi:hypothetical protein